MTDATFKNLNDITAFCQSRIDSKSQEEKRFASLAVEAKAQGFDDEAKKHVKAAQAAATQQRYVGLIMANLSVCGEALLKRRIKAEVLQDIFNSSYSIEKFASLCRVLKTKQMGSEDLGCDSGFSEAMIGIAMYGFNSDQSKRMASHDDIRKQMIAYRKRDQRHATCTQVAQLCKMLERLGIATRHPAQKGKPHTAATEFDTSTGIGKALAEIYAPIVGKKDRLQVDVNLPPLDSEF